MRDPRSGIGWSRARPRRRQDYCAWMSSPAWFALRRAWQRQWIDAHAGIPPACAVCSAPWQLRDGHLHHRSYDRLGHEHPADLTAMCKPCHILLHAVLESSPAWRRMPRSQATDGIVAVLRRKLTESERNILPG